MCADCGLKQPNFGLPSDEKKRWCDGCAKAHVGAVDIPNLKRLKAVGSKKKKEACVDCGLIRASFGLPSDHRDFQNRFKRQWCGGCAKGHPGAIGHCAAAAAAAAAVAAAAAAAAAIRAG
jgi:hypothetical protein